MGTKSRAIYVAAKKAAKDAVKTAADSLLQQAKDSLINVIKDPIENAINSYYETYGTIEPLMSLVGIKIELVPKTDDQGKPILNDKGETTYKPKITWTSNDVKDQWKNLGNAALKMVLGDELSNIIDKVVNTYSDAKDTYNRAVTTYQDVSEPEAEDKMAQDASIETVQPQTGTNITMISENGSSANMAVITTGQAATTVTTTVV